MDDPTAGFPDSAVVILSVEQTLTEAARFTAKDLGVGRIGSVAWTSPTTLALVTFGRFAADQTTLEAPDTIRSLDLTTHIATGPIFRTTSTAFALGGVVCVDQACFVPDAETEGGVIRKLGIGPSGALAPGQLIKVDSPGLPPRLLGLY
jgi:hypothetical protein